MGTNRSGANRTKRLRRSRRNEERRLGKPKREEAKLKIAVALSEEWSKRLDKE